MISKLLIQNFKCLRDVLVGLERFTVFVGPNASGKSSILQAMNLLCSAFRSEGQNVRIGLLNSKSRGAEGAIELAAETARNWYRCRISSSPPSNPNVISKERWDGDGLGMASVIDPKNWTRWKEGNIPLPASVLLRLEASKLIQPAPFQQDQTVMAPDGTGLHSSLANMTLNDPDSWQALQKDLKRIIPTIRRLRHTKSAQMNQQTSVLFDTVGADSLYANQVSEGTLLVLGLLAALHAPGRPSIILLDDLDRGLHPKAQKELITLLRGLLEASPDLQIVASTHSPYMLDCMKVNEVRMTFLKDDGATMCAALTDHPKFPQWKDEMTPGEMWSLFGEKWVTEQEGKA